MDDTRITCRVPECDRLAVNTGLCVPHYKINFDERKRASKRADEQRKGRQLCAIDWCREDVDRRGPGIYCSTHLAANLEAQGVKPPSEPPSPVGKYRQVVHRGKSQPAHRVVMEKHIGRPLVGDENVHHLNGIRDDNRLENLELWSSSQPPGQRVEDKVAWAIEILQRYSPESLR